MMIRFAGVMSLALLAFACPEKPSTLDKIPGTFVDGDTIELVRGIEQPIAVSVPESVWKDGTVNWIPPPESTGVRLLNPGRLTVLPERGPVAVMATLLAPSNSPALSTEVGLKNSKGQQILLKVNVTVPTISLDRNKVGFVSTLVNGQIAGVILNQAISDTGELKTYNSTDKKWSLATDFDNAPTGLRAISGNAVVTVEGEVYMVAGPFTYKLPLTDVVQVAVGLGNATALHRDGSLSNIRFDNLNTIPNVSKLGPSSVCKITPNSFFSPTRFLMCDGQIEDGGVRDAIEIEPTLDSFVHASGRAFTNGNDNGTLRLKEIWPGTKVASLYSLPGSDDRNGTTVDSVELTSTDGQRARHTLTIFKNPLNLTAQPILTETFTLLPARVPSAAMAWPVGAPAAGMRTAFTDDDFHVKPIFSVSDGGIECRFIAFPSGTTLDVPLKATRTGSLKGAITVSAESQVSGFNIAETTIAEGQNSGTLRITKTAPGTVVAKKVRLVEKLGNQTRAEYFYVGDDLLLAIPTKHTFHSSAVNSSVAVKADGSVWTLDGQDYRVYPGFSNIVSVSTAYLNRGIMLLVPTVLAVDSMGRAWAGYNNGPPELIPNLTNVVDVVNSVFLKSDGTVVDISGCKKYSAVNNAIRLGTHIFTSDRRMFSYTPSYSVSFGCDAAEATPISLEGTTKQPVASSLVGGPRVVSNLIVLSDGTIDTFYTMPSTIKKVKALQGYTSVAGAYMLNELGQVKYFVPNFLEGLSGFLKPDAPFELYDIPGVSNVVAMTISGTSGLFLTSNGSLFKCDATDQNPTAPPTMVLTGVKVP
jgi:hypothetical protein